MFTFLSPYRVTLVFAVLFILAHLMAAMVWSHERLFLDSSYYFFHVVNQESFHIEHQRIILAVSQCLLLVGVKLHLSLASLLLIYSITPVLYAALLLAVALLYFRSIEGAWLIVCGMVIGNYFLYYSPMYEVCYSVVTFSFIWLLTERKFYQTPFQILIYSTLLVFSVLGYPLTIFGCIALLGFYLVRDRKLAWQITIVYFLVFALWLTLKVFFLSDYEKGKMPIGHTDMQATIHTILSFTFVQNAVAFFFQQYKPLLASLLLFCLMAVRQHKYVLSISVIISVCLYILLVNYTYQGGGLVHSNNFERMYLILVPMCIAPLLFLSFDRWSAASKYLFIAVAMIVCSYESVTIWQHHCYYTERLEKLDAITYKYTSQGCTKAAIDWAQLSAELDEWSTGMEALIYSSAVGKSLIISDKNTLKAINSKVPIGNHHFLLRLDEVMDLKELNPYYFKLDTATYCE